MTPTIAWQGDIDGRLELIDQTRLPAELCVLRLERVDDVIDAIRRLAVRGAPAIGVAAGYAIVLGVRERVPTDATTFRRACSEVAARVAAARPTAINLGWACGRLARRGEREPTLGALLAEARAIHAEDVALCRAMGENGAPLIPDRATVLTHCNTGRLATAGDGTALAVVFEAWRRGNRLRVIADETRPLLQGARLTAWELAAEGIPVDVATDGAAPALIARGEVDIVLVGADRIAANGDAANKIGTYALALACREHGVPMYVVAPSSSFDLSLPDGAHIPIEDRAADEVLTLGGQRIAPPAGVGARNPAFDVTPGRLLGGLVTDRGVIRPVTTENVKRVLG
ncbi:MAG: S-methyl-5-thioribose-1-phosphate isomerase [Planctomycetes bacterium]|nr:S-methyl-5-thioribose-1-phosphate isomerase [Planctomycetota bacterium]